MPANFSIAAVSNMTGLSIDTLRGWERRYAIVEPSRDASGVRRYSQNDVTRLELAQAAVRLGHSIREIAALPNSRLRSLVDHAAPADPVGDGGAESLLAATLEAVRRYDVTRTEDLLNSAALLLPPETLVVDVLAPVLRSVGSMWQSRECSIAQEHLTSNVVRNLLGALARIHHTGGPFSILFATPAGESHEFGIALAACLAAVRGLRPAVLGTNVPATEVVRTARRLSAKVVVVGAVCFDDSVAVLAYLKEVERGLPERTRLWAGGKVAGLLERKSLGRWEGVATLEDFQRRMARRTL